MPSRPQFGGAAAPLPPAIFTTSAVSIHSISPNHTQRNHTLVVGLAVGGSLTAAIAFMIFFLLLFRRFAKKPSQAEKEAASVNLRKFSYRELKAATRSFDDAQKLGQGGFGVVYRGQLRHGGQQIAVKVLDSTSLQGEREFQNEVSVIGKVSSSPHIVGLLGFCRDTKRGRCLLVYEYMQNRSLQDALFDNTYPVRLHWGDRFKIIMDTANALAFLHTDCEPAIIHGDIKPSNILLDGSFSARIADFGLARFKTDSAAAENLNAQVTSSERRHKRRERQNRKQSIKEESVISVEEAAKIDKDVDVDADADADGDADGNGVVNMQSPETFVSNSQTEENAIFLSSNATSPEGLFETDMVTETKDEIAPSETVDLEKNNVSFITEPSKGKDQDQDQAADGKSTDLTRDDDDKTSVSEGCFDKASVDGGMTGGRRRKDWWWRQDSASREFSVKDYVMEWIGTEIKKERPSSSWATEEEGDSNLGSSRRTEKKKHNWKDGPEWWATLAEKEKKEKPKGTRQGREWWREEYCEELSKKNKKCREWWERDDMEEVEKFRKGRSKSKNRSMDWLSRDWDHHHHHNHHQQRHQYDGDWGSGMSVCSTPSMRGTVCYVAPEHGGGGVPSEKCDVYSFGVVILVIISGRRPLQMMASPITELERANLISWARHLARSGGNVVDLVDPALSGEFDKDKAVLCITVALLCLQKLPAARPSMSEVVKILSGEVEAPPLPVEFSPSPPYGVAFRSRRKSSRAAPLTRPLAPP